MPKSSAKRTARSRRIRAQWQQHISAQQQSGLTQSAYCRANGLSIKYFSLWKGKLAKPETVTPTTSSEAKTPELIPVIVKPAVALATESEKSAPTISSCALPSNDCVLKATLPNGIALEFLFHSAKALSPLLTELAQLPC